MIPKSKHLSLLLKKKKKSSSKALTVSKSEEVAFLFYMDDLNINFCDV